MPNYVANKLVIQAEKEVVQKIREKILSRTREGEYRFDFNRLIQMPKALRKSIFKAKTPAEEKMSDEELDAYRKNLIEQYGADTDYDWSVKYWGTKWNSCKNHIDDNEIIFATAWSLPKPVMIRLSEIFPDVEFELWYMDEGWNFAGHKTYRNGNLTGEYPVASFKDKEAFWRLHKNWIGKIFK